MTQGILYVLTRFVMIHDGFLHARKASSFEKKKVKMSLLEIGEADGVQMD